MPTAGRRAIGPICPCLVPILSGGRYPCRSRLFRSNRALRPRIAVADDSAEMRAESLPEEFVETIATGYWTTCLEILPAKERILGKF